MFMYDSILPASLFAVVHSFLDSWPLTLDRSKHVLTRPTRLQLKPTLTVVHVSLPTSHFVASTWSLAGGGAALAVLLLVWPWCARKTYKQSQVAALSEAAVLRTHYMAARQPYRMPL